MLVRAREIRSAEALWRRVLAACAAVLTSLVVFPAAQTPPPTQTPQQPTFRSRVDTVSVDVSVTDRQGQPVKDLTIADFEVRENRQPQKVDTVRLIEVDDNGGPPPPVLTPQAHARELAREDTRLIIIFLDDYHVRPLNSLSVRDQVARFVSELGPRDLVAVMYPLTTPPALTFTYDHDAVASVISGFQGRKFDYTPRNPIEAQYVIYPADLQEQLRNNMVIQSLTAVCEWLGTKRQGRKAIVYVSEGMMSKVPLGVHTRGAAQGSVPQTAMQATFAQADLQRDMTKIFEAASRANTTIYTLDPRGLGTEYSAEDNMSVPGVPRATVEEDRQRLYTESRDILQIIASQTDGRAIVNRNDLGAGLRQVTRDTGTYYLLGYTTTLPPDGKFHQIDVRVKRSNVEVQHRKGYWAISEAELARAAPPPRPETPGDVSAAIEALETLNDPATRRIVRVWLGASDITADTATVTLVWEAVADSQPADEMDRIDRIDVTATSVAGVELFKGPIARDPQSVRPAGFVTFKAPTTQVQVRLVVQNARGLRLDTDERSFVVPKPSPATVLVTAPAVFRGRTVRDMQQIRAGAVTLPTASRTFSRAERLFLRFQVLAPDGTPPAVTMKILNQGGGTTAALPAPAAGPNGLYESDFSLGGLPGGTHLIEISAAAGPNTTRSLVAIRVAG
jgi:VWFA-related protein